MRQRVRANHGRRVRAWLGLDKDAYIDLYIDRLEALGIEKVKAMLDALSVKAQGKAIVLLCFESLSPEHFAAGQFCSRRIFAEWAEFRADVVILEL